MDIQKLLEDFVPEKYDMDAITDQLEQYYEAAGMADYYERVLSKMDDSELFKYYVETFYSEEPTSHEEAEDPAWQEKRDAEFAELLAGVTRG